jgi:predicted acetyltransferase
VLDTRALTTADLPQAWSLLERAFGGSNHPADQDVELALVEPHRFYATYDGDAPVAVCGSFALQLTVPGGPRPVAGVTWVGVAPTHRRRGLASGLMRRQLDELRAAGEPVACLWASEGAIYQQFGYGPAAWDVALAVPSKARFNRAVDASGIRLTTPDAAVLAPVHDLVAPRIGGWFARDDDWWAYRLHDPEHRRNGAAPMLAAIADGPAGVEGYALYAPVQRWTDAIPSGTVQLRELAATTAEAHARLWRFLLDLDLMKEVRAFGIGPDDPVLHLLAEPRAAKPALKDNLWFRLVDVPAALAARHYAAPVDVVLEVADDFCPWNAGLWRLTGGPDGAACTPTSDAAELAVRASDLGAIYLGGTTLTARAGAGHVRELRPGALAAASTAFGWPGRAPYAPMVF